MKKLIYIGLSIALFGAALISCEKEGIDDNGFGTLSGKVVADGDNVPLENVKITTNPASTTVFTNATGDFIIENIQVGEYSVQAELDEYITDFEPATISLGQTSDVIFEMNLVSDVNLPPNKPILLNPENEAMNVPINLEFRWSNATSDSDEITYNFELRNGTTNELIMAESLSDTLYNVENLDLNRNYFWQVTATDDINEPVASDLGTFTTVSQTTNRFYFTRQVGDNSVIYSGDNTDDAMPNENEIALTSSGTNSFRPRVSQNSGKVAFLRSVGAETHVFVMNLDGTNVQQVSSTIPVNGFRTEEVDIAWARDGRTLYYPSFGKLYQIESDGSGLEEVYEAPAGELITEIARNGVNSWLAISTNDVNGYNGRVVIFRPEQGVEHRVIVEGLEGALGGLDYSFDGTKVLYTHDVSGYEGPVYRPLDVRMFVYDIDDDSTMDISSTRPIGTNDLDPQFSPNEGAVIFTNTSNDGVSQRDVYKVSLDDLDARNVLFNNASMPDWE